jgi:hypothetical protein
MEEDAFHQQQLDQMYLSTTTPVYTDKIADTIKNALNGPDPDKLIVGCGSIKFDLNPDGSFASTTKTLFATDYLRRIYKITVEVL